MFLRVFSFNLLNTESSAGKSVSADDLYTPQKGYGFVTEKNRRQQEMLQYAELNSAFEPLYWYQGQDLTVISQDAAGCFVDSEKILESMAQKEGSAYPGEKRRIPLCFKVNVPKQDNYKVSLTVYAPEYEKDVLIYLGRRHLAYKGDLKAGENFTLTATVNVCDIIPRGQEAIFEDKTLDIAIVGDKVRVVSLQVEEATCPTIYIAGDSTVTDQSASYPYAPGTSYCGWGQMISSYINEEIAVSNHAHSGLTTESFRMEGHYSIVEKYWKPGDYYFIQFAHNDQKLDHLKAEEGYRNNMITYINEARANGVHPVIVTPIARNTWKGNDGTYNDLLKEYGESCIKIGKEMDVPVLDLHQLSMDFIKEMGVEASKPYFFPNDYTHSDDYGGYFMAGYVAGQIKEICGKSDKKEYQILAAAITEGFGKWEPENYICLPEKPQIYEDVKGPEAVQLLSDVDRLEEIADRASVLDMLIKTCRFFPTNVYNDMFVDVVGHEWYAGAVECAYQNGMILPEMVTDKHFFPEKAVTLEEFLIFAMNAYKSRKPWPELSDEEAIKIRGELGICKNAAEEYILAAVMLGVITAGEVTDLERKITRAEAVNMCRRMKI